MHSPEITGDSSLWRCVIACVRFVRLLSGCKMLQVSPRSFQVNLSRNSVFIQDETASVVHVFTTAGTGVPRVNLIL